MENLKAFALTKEILNYLQAGKRVQVRREKLVDIRNMLNSFVTQYQSTPRMMIIIEDVYMAVNSAEESNLVVIPFEMKEVIVEAINGLKAELAGELLNEFDQSEFEFEVGDVTFSLLREAVATQVGGDITNEH